MYKYRLSYLGQLHYINTKKNKIMFSFFNLINDIGRCSAIVESLVNKARFFPFAQLCHR